MRSFAILGRHCALPHAAAARPGELAIDGVTVACALIERKPPTFEPDRQRDSVFVRVLAFSLNFRDRALILRMATGPRQDGFYVIGSDFVAEVIAVGADVTDLAPGDRVIPNGNWTPDVAGTAVGLPTNHASTEIQALPRGQLMRVPRTMEVAVAAAFTIGAQTATAMVRRLAIAPGERVLVTAAHSNTALFVLAALRGRGVEVDGAATRSCHGEALAALGLRRLVVADPRADALGTHEGYAEVLRRGGYDVVIDAFCDLYLRHAGALLRFAGRYATCGYEDQASGYTGQGRPQGDLGSTSVLAAIIMKNLTILGNCLGRTSDLAGAVAAHQAGDFPVVIDSIHRDDPAAFLTRTYLSRDRFGKVVFAYDA